MSLDPMYILFTIDYNKPCGPIKYVRARPLVFKHQ